MKHAGLSGKGRRRTVATATAGLGLLNIALAMIKHVPFRFAPLHDVVPHAAVVGSRYVLLTSGLALLASARGLAHGKRHAWCLAVAAALMSLVAHPFKRADLLGTAATGLTIVLLMGTARLFPARSDPARVQQGVRWLVFGELAVFVYGMVGSYMLDAEFVETTTIVRSFENALRLLFILPASAIEPASRHGNWFINSVRVMSLVVLAVASWHLLHPVIQRAGAGRGERQRVRALLDQYATNALAYFHLLDDKHYYFAGDGRAFIGYKLVGSVAVALGEPVGAADACRAVAASFAQFCDLNGWAFCFYQVTEDGAALLREVGLRSVKIGEEAVIPVQTFALTGKHFKGLRNATNRLEREGYTVEQAPRPIDDHTMDELEEVSDAWLAQGGHRERGFTLGAFDRDYLRETMVFVVRSPSGRIEAFANVIPSFRSSEGNFDLMRRRADAVDSAMDFLFVHLIDYFKAQGFTGMNLGLAPLAGIEGTGVVARALRLLYERGERAFNFRGLRDFKDKWRPDWQPRYLVYRSDLQLPQIALAVARAGERAGSSSWSVRGWLGHKLRPRLQPASSPR